MDIRNAVVLITGASAGLGEATARLFARHGAKVALAARSADKLNRLASELQGSLAIPVDLRDQRAIASMVDTVHAHYGRVDLLINNAGQGMYGLLEQVEVEQYRKLMDLNVYAPLLAMQAVIPIMRTQGGGMILNISTPLAQMPIIPGLGAYGATKAANSVLTHTARAELAAQNIRVGAIYPGMMATEANRHRLAPSTAQPAQGAEAAYGPPPGAPVPEAPEAVAAKILEAAQLELAEQYTESFKQLVAWVSSAAGAF